MRSKRLKSQSGWIPKSMVETKWKRRKLGLLGVFARIGKGGAWDLAASYVMVANIVCTTLAIVVTVRAEGWDHGDCSNCSVTRHDESRSDDVLGAISFAATLFHLVVALWLWYCGCCVVAVVLRLWWC